MEINRGHKAQSFFNGTVQDIAVMALFVCMYYTNKSHGDEVSDMLFSRVNLLFVGYFLFRLLFQWGGRIAQIIVLLVIEAIICYESLLGLFQIIGLAESNNYLFTCTGTFENPGPLGGFLAIGLCVSLTVILRIKQQRGLKAPSIVVKPMLYISYLTVILCAIIIPSTQSRAAWLSIMISAVLYCLRIPNTIIWIKAHWLVTISFIFVFISFIVLFKRQSTNGRLFTYKVELMTIKRTGFNGVGMGHFSNAYGITQRDYFSKTISLQDGLLIYHVSDKERLYADNPKVGFNDYLQFGIEFGIGPLVLFLSLVVLVLCRLSRLNTPCYYGMVSMLVFAFFSYPFSLWEFLVIFLVFTAISGCSPESSCSSTLGRLLFTLSCLIPVVIFHKSAYTVRQFYITEKLWERQRPIFDSGDYRSYDYCCSQLYLGLKYNCAFLYEYAYSLFENGDLVGSEKFLNQSLALCGNQLSFILMGDIHKSQGRYVDAELDYYNSFLALPDRLYPLYKMAVLYYDSNQQDKYERMIRCIDEFHPRIESESTNEIRERLNSHKYEYEKTQ